MYICVRPLSRVLFTGESGANITLETFTGCSVDLEPRRYNNSDNYVTWAKGDVNNDIFFYHLGKEKLYVPQNKCSLPDKYNLNTSSMALHIDGLDLDDGDVYYFEYGADVFSFDLQITGI